MSSAPLLDSITFPTRIRSGSRFGNSVVGCTAVDPAPQIRRAGVIGLRDPPFMVDPEGPPTPAELRPFRKSPLSTVGTTVRHWGSRNDPPLDEDLRHGVRAKESDTVEDCLKPAFVDRMGAMAAENAEKRYLSNKREPLGKVPEPSIPIPDYLIRNGFGIMTKTGESAKNLIYSCGDKEAPELFPAGVQRDRKYQWGKVGIDPSDYRFGVASKICDNTRDLIAPAAPPTTILPRIVRDYKATVEGELEHTRPRGSGCKDDPDFVYGKKGKQEEFDVHYLLSTHGTKDDDEYERTLGRTFIKSHTQRKLAGLEDDQGRIYGVPSIRTDLSQPSFRRTANGNNYGDEVGAKALIYPNRYIAKGIDTKYFVQPLTLEEIGEKVAIMNMDLPSEAVERAFNYCQNDDVCTIEQFKDACEDLGL